MQMNAGERERETEQNSEDLLLSKKHKSHNTKVTLNQQNFARKTAFKAAWHPTSSTSCSDAWRATCSFARKLKTMSQSTEENRKSVACGVASTNGMSILDATSHATDLRLLPVARDTICSLQTKLHVTRQAESGLNSWVKEVFLLDPFNYKILTNIWTMNIRQT